MSRAKGVPKSAEHNRKVSEALKGRKFTATHILNLSKPKTEAHKEALRLAQTPEVKAKRKAAHIAKHGFATYLANPINNAYCIEYWTSRGYSEDQAKSQISERQKVNSRLRKKHVSHWTKVFWEAQGLTAEEAKLKVSALQLSNSLKSIKTVSRSGTAAIDSLEALLGISFDREVTLLDRFKVDGLNVEHKIVIEFFGTFWHMHPTLFGPEDRHNVTGWKAESKWREDGGRIKLLKMNGYKVYVIWEHEASEEFLQQLAEEIKNACSIG